MSNRPTLIVALDFSEGDQALALCESLDGLVDYYKVGSELFTAAGPDIVGEICRSGSQVFLDLKYHDIPNTVKHAVRAALRLGASLVDVHASGGPAMMKAAAEVVRESETETRPLVFGVTVLTHLGDEDMHTLGWESTSRHQVVRLARLAHECGLDGVVASAHEVEAVREVTEGKLDVLVPGVRPHWAGATHDQKRVATPAEVVRAGARFVVVGRAIAAQADPRIAAIRILEEIDQAQANRV